jgi:DNA-directed RNA polymerase specialized sigma24 family protein
MILFDAECRGCGRVRTLRAWWPHEVQRFARRRCRACTLKPTTPPQVGAGEPDEMAVERLVSGSPVQSYPADRKAAVEYLTARGLTARQIADRLRVSDRTVTRWRRSLREAA